MPAMNIAVLIKQVPDTYSERVLKDSDWTLDRDAADAVIDEIDSRGVEAALQLVEQHGGEVTVVTMGPERSTETVRKALAMGADKAVHISDDGLAGSDALQTSAALAATYFVARSGYRQPSRGRHPPPLIPHHHGKSAMQWWSRPEKPTNSLPSGSAGLPYRGAPPRHDLWGGEEVKTAF